MIVVTGCSVHGCSETPDWLVWARLGWTGLGLQFPVCGHHLAAFGWEFPPHTATPYDPTIPQMNYAAKPALELRLDWPSRIRVVRELEVQEVSDVSH